MNDPSAARMAENEATFREANEHIQDRARALEFSDAIPFLCECGAPECRELLRLTPEEYETVRRNGAYFFVLPGHESVSGDVERVVERHEAYAVLEKLGTAGKVAGRRDPRQTA